MTDALLSPADRLAIDELLALYGHIIDGREWTRLEEIFTPDAVFDASDFGSAPIRGREQIRELWSRPETRHPLAHHATNIVVTGVGSETVDVLSKGLGVGDRGRVGSITYRDVVARTPAGWRIAHRVATLQRPRS